MKALSLENDTNKVFLEGFRDSIPIGLGYLAVAFSLGIAAKNAGLNPVEAFFSSFLCSASAGEYAGFTSIQASASYIEIAVITFIANARYLLMSATMSQRIAPGTSIIHRLLLAFYLSDELFAIAIARPGFINPFYSYGAFIFAIPCWSFGTALGTVAGSLLPMRLVSALSVSLYGMFLAIVIPPARKSKIIAAIVAVSFAASFAAANLPFVKNISSGTRTIILTVVISALAAILFPRKSEEEEA